MNCNYTSTHVYLNVNALSLLYYHLAQVATTIAINNTTMVSKCLSSKENSCIAMTKKKKKKIKNKKIEDISEEKGMLSPTKWSNNNSKSLQNKAILYNSIYSDS